MDASDLPLASSATGGDTAATSNAAPQDEENGQPDAKIPVHLRRKVEAKRPPLGHIVPKRPIHKQGKLRKDGSYSNPSMLKILGGTQRGKRLNSPQVYLRPMMGKVREAVYSTFTYFTLYEQDLCRHLDIFSGSGSVGLESLSRGASHCTFVDLSPDCCRTCESNIELCSFQDRANIICGDAMQTLTNPDSVGIPEQMTYQIVTICPPYEEVVYADLLDAVANSRVVTDDTIVLVEYPVELGCLPHVYQREDGGAMIGIRNRRYGRTVIAMYIVNPSGKLPAAESRPEEFVTVHK